MSNYSGGASSTSSSSGSSGSGEATFQAEMQQEEAQSQEDSLIETQANVVINQNNAVAQTSAGVGRE
jgi:hypothetical protein